MRELLEEDVANGLEPIGGEKSFPWSRVSGARDGDVTYIYFGEHQPRVWTTGLPKEDGDYELHLIDTWNMEITPLSKVTAPQSVPTRHGSTMRPKAADAAFAVELPSKPYLAIRCRKKA